MDIKQLIKICEDIATDMKRDAEEFDGKPVNGKIIATYFGYHGAAIAALANIIQEILKNNGEESTDKIS